MFPSTRRLRAVLIFSLLVLPGCAVCERHPAACAVAGAVIVGSAVATLEAHHGGQAGRVVEPRMSPCDPRRSCQP